MEGPDHVIGQTRESEHTMQTALGTRGPIQGADNTRTTDHEDRRIQFKRQTASDNKERITRREKGRAIMGTNEPPQMTKGEDLCGIAHLQLNFSLTFRQASHYAKHVFKNSELHTSNSTKMTILF